MLVWPDKLTDWVENLSEVQTTYLALIRAINLNSTGVILLCRADQIDSLKQRISNNAQVLLVVADYNDTWVRDYGFLTCQSPKGMQPIEYQFNCWGNKFNADKDNRINQQVLADLCRLPLLSHPLVLEGGALEIDQHQHLLSTQSCLLNPERNGKLSLREYCRAFSSQLGAKNVSIFQHGHLQGDDTDGHIDTLVRFTPDEALVVQGCFNRPDDSHFAGLTALVEECRRCLPENQLFELPLPHVENTEGERLPASYANYLINNGQILMPVYQAEEDQQALTIAAQAHPNFEVVAIDALPLVQQFGSIHCISMQVPIGTLKPQIIERLKGGVSCWSENNED